MFCYPTNYLVSYLVLFYKFSANNMPKVKSKLIAINHLLFMRLTNFHYLLNISCVIFNSVPPTYCRVLCPTPKIEATEFSETFMPTC